MTVLNAPAIDDRSCATTYPQVSDYMAVLQHFPRYAERGWHGNFRGDPDCGYFADSGSGENGLRTNGSFVFVAALLASDESYDERVGGVSREHLLSRARQVIKYMTQSHRSSNGTCADGGKWGRDWQSSWWATKMVLGARLIWDHLDYSERAAVDRLLAFEADRHLDRVVPSGIAIDTKAEENAWDTEILATALAHLPDHASAPAWREKLIEFGLNTLSTPQDRFDESTVSGVRVKDGVYTTNVHSDFTLENHGSSHFCYIASPLVSVAWSYYALLSSGQEVPDALFHHVTELWNEAKPTFLGERFAYVGGKDWARYTYGLYFIVPALVMLQQRFGDTDARNIENARLKSLLAEHADNDDGSFYGKRVTRSRFFGQYAKYETDCYAKLGLAYLLHRDLRTTKEATPDEEFREKQISVKVSPESHTCFANTKDFFSSFSWNTLTKPWPMATFIPNGMDDVVEWEANNLLGRVRFLGETEAVGVRSAKEKDGGFVVQGTVVYRHGAGERMEHRLSFDVNPERAIVDSEFIAKSKFLVVARDSINLYVVNDWFNGFERRYFHQGGENVITFDPEAADRRAAQSKAPAIVKRVQSKLSKAFGFGVETKHFESPWINIDNKLGVIHLDPSEGSFYLREEGRRNTPAGCLHYNTLAGTAPLSRPFYVRPGEQIVRTKIAVVAATAEETAALAKEWRS
ncbi:MAG: hypothetical protein AAF517_10900 [Planctomycetota bacterium]